MKTKIGTFWFCDKHGRAGTDEEKHCCKQAFSMGWYETAKEQEERVEVSSVSTVEIV